MGDNREGTDMLRGLLSALVCKLIWAIHCVARVSSGAPGGPRHGIAPLGLPCIVPGGATKRARKLRLTF